MSEEYVDLYQAAEELGVTRQTLYRLMKEREIPRFRRPGNIRTMMRRGDLEQLREPVRIDDAPRRGRPRGKVAA